MFACVEFFFLSENSCGVSTLAVLFAYVPNRGHQAYLVKQIMLFQFLH